MSSIRGDEFQGLTVLSQRLLLGAGSGVGCSECSKYWAWIGGKPGRAGRPPGVDPLTQRRVMIRLLGWLGVVLGGWVLLSGGLEGVGAPLWITARQSGHDQTICARHLIGALLWVCCSAERWFIWFSHFTRA